MTNRPSGSGFVSETALATALAAKSPLASPSFTGTPTAPTAAGGTNSNQVATTAFIQAALTALLNGAPGALDTLKELADAIGDDANYAATITTALAAKATPTLVDAKIAAQAVIDAATYLPFWKPNTAYLAGQRAVSPSGQTITANADFTSGASYVPGNWTIVASGGGTVSDATTTAKGVVQLAGDLGGTASAPTVPGLAGKAPLASPTFSGIPAVPTATAGTTTTQAASTAFVKAAIEALIAGAPGALDTLAEIAAQLATDESAASALMAQLNQRTISVAPVTLSATGTMTANAPNLLDATAGAVTATLPTPVRIGQVLMAERVDTSVNLISFGGTIRGVAAVATMPGLGVAGEAFFFVAESLTSWRIAATHKPTALLAKQYDALGAATAAAIAPTRVNTDQVSSRNAAIGVCTGTSMNTGTFGTPVRYQDVYRRKIIVQNKSAVTLQIGYGTTNSVSPPTWGSTQNVAAGQEWVGDPGRGDPVWFRDSGGTAVTVAYTTEVGV